MPNPKTLYNVGEFVVEDVHFGIYAGEKSGDVLWTWCPPDGWGML